MEQRDRSDARRERLQTQILEVEHDAKHQKDTHTALQRAVASSERTALSLRRELEGAESEARSSKSHFKSVKAIEKLKRRCGYDSIFGFLWELAVVEPVFSDALNSVLQSYLGVVVVRSRNTALEVTETFTTESVGRVSCCIQDELAASASCHPSSCGFDGAHDHTVAISTSDPIPLCRTFTCKDDKYRPVFHRYCAAWLVCEDYASAERISTTSGKSCVTLRGDLYFADGSIRAFQKYDQTNKKGEGLSRRRLRVESTGERDGSTVAEDRGLSRISPNFEKIVDKIRQEEDDQARLRTELERVWIACCSNLPRSLLSEMDAIA